MFLFVFICMNVHGNYLDKYIRNHNWWLLLGSRGVQGYLKWEFNNYSLYKFYV